MSLLETVEQNFNATFKDEGKTYALFCEYISNQAGVSMENYLSLDIQPRIALAQDFCRDKEYDFRTLYDAMRESYKQHLLTKRVTEKLKQVTGEVIKTQDKNI